MSWWPTLPEIQTWRCPTCEVGWRAADPACWTCGRRGELGNVLDLHASSRLPQYVARRYWPLTRDAATDLLRTDLERTFQ